MWYVALAAVPVPRQFNDALDANGAPVRPLSTVYTVYAVQVKSKPQDQGVIDACIEKLEGCGAIEECCVDSKRMVEEAWGILDRAIPESFFKIMLRTVGLFVTADQSATVVSARC